MSIATGNHFLFLNNAQPLQNIASFKYALELWRQYQPSKYTSDLPLTDLKNLFTIKHYDAYLIVSQLPVPASIRETISEYIQWIKSEIDTWLELNDHHDYNISPVFFEPFVFFTRFDELLWNYTNFTINFEATAENMLKNSGHLLNSGQIFVVACTYCFKEIIFHVKEPEWENVQIASPNGFRETIVDYWMDRDQFDDSFDIRTIDLFLSLPIRNVSAYRYMWNNFDEESQVGLISEIIRHGNFHRLFYTFSSLSEEQWGWLIHDDGFRLMTGLLQGYLENKHILQLWNYINDMFDENQFIELISFNLHSRIHCCNPTNDCVHKSIWTKASDRLKSNTLERLLNKMGFFKTKGFLQLLLKSASDSQKMNFLHTKTSSLLRSNTAMELSYLMYSCFSTYHIDEFRKIIRSDSPSMANRKCYDLFFKARFEELNFFICWLRLSQPETIQLKQEILRVSLDGSLKNQPFSSEYRFRFAYSHFDELQALDRFISEAFQNQSDAMAEYKYDLVSALTNLQMFPDILSNANKLPAIVEFVNFFISSEHPSHSEIKRQLMDRYRKFVVEGNFYLEQEQLSSVDSFISWGLEDDDAKIIEFKNLFPAMEICDRDENASEMKNMKRRLSE